MVLSDFPILENREYLCQGTLVREDWFIITNQAPYNGRVRRVIFKAENGVVIAYKDSNEPTLYMDMMYHRNYEGEPEMEEILKTFRKGVNIVEYHVE